MRGDLLFYTPKDWVGRLIAWFTNGPFCHVAIDLGDGTKIEADWNGVVRPKTNNREPSAIFHTAKDATKLDDAIYWLKQQQGNPYGKEDIVNQVFRLMGFHFFIGQPKHYDCSDLASQFLEHAGLGWMLGSSDPHLITPNLLAQLIGVKLGGK